MIAWGLVPARGGSKSIPYKNLVPVAGIPLLDYGALAAQSSGVLDRIVCSTDDDMIAGRARHLGIEVDRRPDHLATDDAAVADVARDFLSRQPVGNRPDVIVLIQPTSPFLLPQHVRMLVKALESDLTANSAQTVTTVPHNHHAWNQRVVDGDYVSFHFEAERAIAYNKQKKPKLYIFGNLVAARSRALLAGESFFAKPSVFKEIPWPYDLDLDSPQDLKLAEAMLSAGLVDLPHIIKTEP
ncbi:MAG: acylneuraminate cytidylyltransferase family protein [Alphaproteobacteria bacterium]|nr:acylneuraminate cytidylyltransferase family protein [Alphaproteobacteria bacterium]